MADQQLATIADFETFGGKAAAFSSFTDDQKNAALVNASDEFLAYAATREAAPIATWGKSYRKHVCKIAAFDLLSSRGANPANPDALVLGERAYDRAIAYAKDIGKGLANPPDVVDATPDVADAAPIGASPTDQDERWGTCASEVIP